MMLPDTTRYFSEKELANLSIAIAMFNAWNRLAIGSRPVHPGDLAKGSLTTSEPMSLVSRTISSR